MARRIHVSELAIGDLPLDPVQAHHARHVLRLGDGAEVEAFDDAGARGPAVLLHLPDGGAAVRVERIDTPAGATRFRWSVAAAVPKGERADWMVEKLSELGTSAFIPLAAARSVVLPEGRNKRERWTRLATESAKQSRRAGVMTIGELTTVHDAIARVRAPAIAISDIGEAQQQSRGWFLATEVPGLPIAAALEAAREIDDLTLFVGPEGGWTPQEIEAFQVAGLTAVRLTASVLRVETASVAAAAIVAAFLGA